MNRSEVIETDQSGVHCWLYLLLLLYWSSLSSTFILQQSLTYLSYWNNTPTIIGCIGPNKVTYLLITDKLLLLKIAAYCYYDVV